MASRSEKGDIRVVKTTRALFTAMRALLEKRDFKRITVKDICDETSISRAAFYSHFTDKYDLLEYWLASLKPDWDNITQYDTCEEFENAINKLINQNKVIIKNIITHADAETIDIVFNFLLSSLDLTIDNIYDKDTNQKFVVLSTFYAGGMVNYLCWCVDNKLPFDVMNVHLFKIIQKFKEWRLQ